MTSFLHPHDIDPSYKDLAGAVSPNDACMRELMVIGTIYQIMSVAALNVQKWSPLPGHRQRARGLRDCVGKSRSKHALSFGCKPDPAEDGGFVGKFIELRTRFWDGVQETLRLRVGDRAEILRDFGASVAENKLDRKTSSGLVRDMVTGFRDRLLQVAIDNGVLFSDGQIAAFKSICERYPEMADSLAEILERLREYKTMGLPDVALVDPDDSFCDVPCLTPDTKLTKKFARMKSIRSVEIVSFELKGGKVVLKIVQRDRKNRDADSLVIEIDSESGDIKIDDVLTKDVEMVSRLVGLVAETLKNAAVKNPDVIS